METEILISARTSSNLTVKRLEAVIAAENMFDMFVYILTTLISIYLNQKW